MDLESNSGKNPVIITNAWYAKVMVEQKPSRFVTKMSYAAVGYDYLRQCYIEDSDLNPYPKPYPARIRILIFKFFKKFLIEKGYTGLPLANEIGSYNVYLGYSCTYARKRHARLQKKAQNKQKKSLIEELFS